MSKVTSNLRYKSFARSGTVTARGLNAVRGSAAWDMVVSDIEGVLIPEIRAELDRVALKTVTDINNDIKEQLSSKGRPHRRSGDLWRSIQLDKLGEASYVIGTDLFYAAFLEFGTSRHRPYPFFMNNVRKHSEAFLKGVRRVMAK